MAFSPRRRAAGGSDPVICVCGLASGRDLHTSETNFETVLLQPRKAQFRCPFQACNTQTAISGKDRPGRGAGRGSNALICLFGLASGRDLHTSETNFETVLLQPVLLQPRKAQFRCPFQACNTQTAISGKDRPGRGAGRGSNAFICLFGLASGRDLHSFENNFETVLLQPRKAQFQWPFRPEEGRRGAVTR